MGVQDDLISAGETEVEYSGLQMVDPDDRMEMLWHHVVPVTGELNWCFLREGAAWFADRVTLRRRNIPRLIQVKSEGFGTYRGA